MMNKWKNNIAEKPLCERVENRENLRCFILKRGLGVLTSCVLEKNYIHMQTQVGSFPYLFTLLWIFNSCMSLWMPNEILVYNTKILLLYPLFSFHWSLN